MLLEDYEKQLDIIKSDISGTENIDMESDDFIKFAFEFTEKMKEKWWSISFDERRGGEQILFNGKFFVDNSANVHTPSLSTIYRLGTNKKALSEVDNAHLVELAGYRPPRPPVYLWHIFYRHSPFCGLSIAVFKRTNIRYEQSVILSGAMDGRTRATR